jgi:hypothetical protein
MRRIPRFLVLSVIVVPILATLAMGLAADWSASTSVRTSLVLLGVFIATAVVGLLLSTLLFRKHDAGEPEGQANRMP